MIELGKTGMDPVEIPVDIGIELLAELENIDDVEIL